MSGPQPDSRLHQSKWSCVFLPRPAKCFRRAQVGGFGGPAAGPFKGAVCATRCKPAVQGADAIAHGSTGAGNDQIRFDMTFLVMAPGVEIITLTRDMALSRQEEIDYLNKHGFAADFTKLKYSYNVGLWGTSICGCEIRDSAQGLPESAYL